MKNTLKTYLNTVEVGEKQSYKNLAVYPLFSDYTVTLGYLTLDEALEQDVVEVAEIDAAGTVPELKVVNRSDQMVLILDGEELVGAKQNRIVNTTIIVAAGSVTVIPVSCVEQGRWSYASSKFSSRKRMMSPQMRATKSMDVQYCLKQRGTFHADQGTIWREVAHKAQRMDAMSDSMDMDVIYERQAQALDKYVRRFEWTKRQVGAVFAIDGRIVGADGFGRADTFEKSFAKIVQSYALDAIDTYRRRSHSDSQTEDAAAFLKCAADAAFESYPSVGLGSDCRLDSDRISGFALVHDHQVLHVSAFAKVRGAGSSRPSSRLQRFSRRRGRRIA